MDAPTAQSLLEFAERAAPELRGPEPKDTLEEVTERYVDLLDGLQWFLDHDRTDDALRLANALYPFWNSQQRFEDGATWFDRALEAHGGDGRTRGLASVNAGFMPFWTGDDGRASHHFSKGLEIGRSLSDDQITTRALGGLARVALRSDVAEGRRLAAEALEVATAADDDAGRSNAMHLLGVGANIADDLPEARRWMTARLALVREMGNQAMVSSEAANLSMVERKLGNLDAAEELVREALDIAERRGDEFMKPFALSGLAAVAMDRGQHERSATLVGAAETIMAAQGAAWPPDERPQYEHMLAVLPGALGEAAFERARAAGQAMTTTRAVAYALGPS